MWLFELLGLTVVVGVFLGLGWRFAEDFLDRRHARKALETEFAGNSTTESTPATVAVATTSSANSRSN